MMQYHKKKRRKKSYDKALYCIMLYNTLDHMIHYHFIQFCILHNRHIMLNHIMLYNILYHKISYHFIFYYAFSLLHMMYSLPSSGTYNSDSGELKLKYQKVIIHQNLRNIEPIITSTNICLSNGICSKHINQL